MGASACHTGGQDPLAVADFGEGPSLPYFFLGQNRGAKIFLFTKRSKPSVREQLADYHGYNKNAHYWRFFPFIQRYLNGPE